MKDGMGGTDGRGYHQIDAATGNVATHWPPPETPRPRFYDVTTGDVRDVTQHDFGTIENAAIASGMTLWICRAVMGICREIVEGKRPQSELTRIRDLLEEMHPPRVV